MVNVGTKYNISWAYTKAVTNLPSYFDIYMQDISLATTWKKQIASKVPAVPQWFWYTPLGLADGKYKIRLVPDGKETFNVPVDQQPCFSNGQAIPSVSAAFSVVNPRGGLQSYPESYPANSGAVSQGRLSEKRLDQTSSWLLVGLMVMISMYHLL